jgi:4-amino-4-deoxy-L-arabinose transferase-like glycosyltransferase
MNKKTTYGLLVTLWFLHVAANFIWLKVDTLPPFWDTAGHAISALRVAQLPFVTDFPTTLNDLLAIVPYPPLMYLASAPLALLFWPTVDSLLGVSVLFIGLLLLSTYGIADAFAGRKVGLLAAFIVSMYPIIYGLSRHYLLDLPLVAMVALAIWLLIRTEDFERRGPAILTGLSLGLGMLIKWTFAVFVTGPFLLSIARVLMKRTKNRWLNLSLALLVGAITAAPWYLHNLFNLLDFLGLGGIYGTKEGDPLVGSWESSLYYVESLLETQILFPFALLFLIGLILLLTKYGIKYETGLLLSWIIIPLVIFTNFINKDIRYTLPYLPAMAVITALGIASLEQKKLRNLMVVSLALYAVVQFVGLSWGLSHRLPDGLLPPRLSIEIGPSRLWLYAESIHIASPPRSENWQAQTILRDIMSSSQGIATRKLKLITVLPDAAFFEPNVFTYYSLVEDYPFEVRRITGILQVNESKNKILASDFLISKSGSLGPEWTVQKAGIFINELRDPASELGRQFELIGEYKLPDGSLAELYQHVRENVSR